VPPNQKLPRINRPVDLLRAIKGFQAVEDVNETHFPLSTEISITGHINEIASPSAQGPRTDNAVLRDEQINENGAPVGNEVHQDSVTDSA
jgi:hypothetical protein